MEIVNAETLAAFAHALKSAIRKMDKGSFTPPKGEATPKNHTPTGKGPEGWTPMPSSKITSSAKNKRRAKNRIAKASRKKNRS